MKKLGIYILLAALACSLPLLSGRDKGNVKYFRHLRMYKIHNLDFAYPVDPKDHKKINCFAVEYDDNNRIVNAVYLRQGQIGFDIDNNLSHINIIYLPDNEKWHVKRMGEAYSKNVEYESFDFDSTGRLLSCTNYSEDGMIVEDTMGIARQLYTTDSLNNVLTCVGLNIVGEPIIDSSGFYKIAFRYDKKNNLVEAVNYDENGRYLMNADGYAIERFEYDQNGNCTEEHFYDSTDNPAFNNGENAVRISYKYDENGNMIGSELLDEIGNLLYDQKRCFTYYQIKYSESGEISEITNYFQKDVPAITELLDEKGKLVKRIEYSVIGRPEEYADENYDYQVIKYDKRKKGTEISFHNTDGSLYELKEGYAIIKNKFDKAGNVVASIFYSPSEELTEIKSSGIAIYKYKYDKNNFNIEVAKYGLDGKLKNAKDDGVARIVSHYDDDGIPLGISYFGADGKLKVPKGQSWAKQKFYYDEKKRPRGFGFHGENDELVFDETWGFACILFEYNDADSTETLFFFDADSNLIGESTGDAGTFKP